MTANDLRALFSNLSEQEATVAKDTLGRYFVIAWEICSNRYLEGDSPSMSGGAPRGIEKQPDS